MKKECPETELSEEQIKRKKRIKLMLVLMIVFSIIMTTGAILVGVGIMGENSIIAYFGIVLSLIGMLPVIIIGFMLYNPGKPME